MVLFTYVCRRWVLDQVSDGVACHCMCVGPLREPHTRVLVEKWRDKVRVVSIERVRQSGENFQILCILPASDHYDGPSWRAP